MKIKDFYKVKALCFCVLFTVLAALNLSASTIIETRENSGISIEINQLFSEQPHVGTMPISIHINNQSPSDHEWTFTFIVKYDYRQSKHVSYTSKIQVPALSNKLIPLSIPILPTQKSSFSIQATVDVQGYGLKSDNVRLYSHCKNYDWFFLTTEFLNADVWEKVLKEKTAKNEALSGDRLNYTDFPSDWRALIGVDGAVLHNSEWDKLTAQQQEAMRTWLAMGGRLFQIDDVQGGVSNVFNRSNLKLNEYGLGSIQWIGVDASTKKVASENIHSQVGFSDSNLAKVFDDKYYFDGSNVLSLYKDIQKPSELGVLIIFIMLSYSLVVGPINMKYFAPPGKRHRLFFTTPIISFLASGVIFLGIICSDGFGGVGNRISLNLIMPDLKRMICLQDQACRTNLLHSTRFDMTPEVYMALLPINEKDKDYTYQCKMDSNNYWDDWFISRSLIAHHLRTVKPHRSDISVKLSDSGEPIVSSSINHRLKKFYYRDSNDTLWHAESVTAGKPIPLKSANVEANLIFGSEEKTIVKTELYKVFNKKNWFVAEMENPDEGMIPTLSSIQWKNQTAYIAGPVLNDGKVKDE